MALKPIKVIISGVDNFSKTIGKVEKDLSKIGRVASNIGRGMTVGLTLPTIAFGGWVLKTAADFELSMKKVQVLTGATGEEFTALGKLARKLGAETQFSSSDAAEAMDFLAAAGFDVKQVMAAVPGVMQLAASASLSMGQSASIVADTLLGYGLKVTEVNRVNDVLVKTFTSSKQTLTDLGEAFQYGGAVASQAGIRFEETSAVLGLLAKSGLRASIGGTALRGIITSLLVPSGEAIKVFEKFNIPKSALVNSQGHLKSMRKVIEVLGKSGADTGDIMKIFGERAGPGMLTLLKEGTSGLDTFVGKLDKAGGTAEHVGGVQMGGLTGQMRELSGAFEEFRLRLADAGILRWATDGVKWLTKVVGKMNALSPAFMRIAVIGSLVLAALGPIIAVFGSILSGLSAFASVWPVIVAVLGAVSAPVWGIVAAVIGGVAAFILLLATSKTLQGIIAKMLPFLKLLGFVVWKSLVFSFKYLAWCFKNVLLPAVNFILKPLELLLDLITSVSRVVLPEWLQKKIGLNTEVNHVSDATKEVAAKAAQGAQGGKNVVDVNFRNLPRGVDITDKSKSTFGGGFNIYTGLAWQ